MKTSEKIAACRKERGMSQEELASALNISRQAVSRWETSAATPDTEKIIQLSRVFGVTTDYLLLDEVEEKRPDRQPKTIPEAKTEPAAEVSVAVSVKERRRKFRMMAWISLLVIGLLTVFFALIAAGIWADTTDWYWTGWGPFGTALFRTWRFVPLLIGLVLMIPGIAGLVQEYKRGD